ncbi:MAG: hypothetical protein RLZZ28_218 [Bacteroidota bacterium]
MKQLTLFRILTYTLLPIVALFGFLDMLVILGALANPAMLLFAFLLTSLIIYVFSSLKFLTKGIDLNRPCKPSLRDWIKVNAYVSAFMGTMFFMNSLSIFFMSTLSLRQFIAQVMESQPTMPPVLTIDLFTTIMRGMSYFMFLVSVVLLLHIAINFRLLKKYVHLFGEYPPE